MTWHQDDMNIYVSNISGQSIQTIQKYPIQYISLKITSVIFMVVLKGNSACRITSLA